MKGHMSIFLNKMFPTPILGFVPSGILPRFRIFFLPFPAQNNKSSLFWHTFAFIGSLSLISSAPQLVDTISLDSSSTSKMQLQQHQQQLESSSASPTWFMAIKGSFSAKWPKFITISYTTCTRSALLWRQKWSKRSILIHSVKVAMLYIISKVQRNSPSLPPRAIYHGYIQSLGLFSSFTLLFPLFDSCAHLCLSIKGEVFLTVIRCRLCCMLPEEKLWLPVEGIVSLSSHMNAEWAWGSKFMFVNDK